MLKNREEDCLAVLAKLRGGDPDSPMVRYEFCGLQAEQQAEREATMLRYGSYESTWRTELMEYKRIFTTKPLLHRVFLGAAVQGLGQWTGISKPYSIRPLMIGTDQRLHTDAIIYYAPTVFEQLGLSGGTIGLLATGLVGVVNFVMTIPAVLFIDNIGRRPMLCWGEANMAVSHAGVAAIVAIYGQDFASHKMAGNAAVFLIYWFITNYAVAYGPVGWVVAAEVFPLNIRAKGISIAAAVNWIMNFAVAQVTPVMQANIGYKMFIVFMCFCILGFFWALLLLPELKGLSLEEIDRVFKDDTSEEDRQRRARIESDVGLDKVTEVARTESIKC